MAVFLTGATGYIGSYVAHGLLTRHKERLALLVRGANVPDAERRLWRSLQLHFDFDTFHAYLRDRVDIYPGDLTLTNFGLDSHASERLIKSVDSVIHCAASLNRRSEKACLNVNLRGTLEVLKIARAAQDHHGLRRFSDISTVAVAGKRHHEVVAEDRAVEWNRGDYDPYARTKKFCEHMAHELLPDVPVTVFRPSTVLGDSRFPQTTQFDMVRAFVFLARLPVLPFGRNWKLDIVPADYVGKAIVEIHQSASPSHDTYHLSSGVNSPTYSEILRAMVQGGFRMRHFLTPWLLPPFRLTLETLARTPRFLGLAPLATLMKVFLPYLTYDTVFDNRRVREALKETPKPFTEYALPLFRFARDHRFTYPYREWGAKSAEFKKVQVA